MPDALVNMDEFSKLETLEFRMMRKAENISDDALILAKSSVVGRLGLLAFLSGIDRRIFDDVYVPLGDVWDAAVIVNSAVNFILYCTMSAQFRRTFAEVICRRRRRDGAGQQGTEMRERQRDNDGGMFVRWRIILRNRTAPVTSLIHCTGIFSSPDRPKPASPV